LEDGVQARPVDADDARNACKMMNIRKTQCPVWFNAWLYEREEIWRCTSFTAHVLEELKGRPELNSLKNKYLIEKHYFLKTVSFDLMLSRLIRERLLKKM